LKLICSVGHKTAKVVIRFGEFGKSQPLCLSVKLFVLGYYLRHRFDVSIITLSAKNVNPSQKLSTKKALLLQCLLFMLPLPRLGFA
jgi:hypothetical protein